MRVNEVGHELCEVCNLPLPYEPLEDCICRERQDAVWYGNAGGNVESIALVFGTRLLIERRGYTKFYFYEKGIESGESITLQNTEDFIKAGLTTDKELGEAFENEQIEIEDSPWFEVWDLDTCENLEDFIGTELDEAYAYAIKWWDENGKDRAV